jgi:hypothetical protein
VLVLHIALLLALAVLRVLLLVLMGFLVLLGQYLLPLAEAEAVRLLLRVAALVEMAVQAAAVLHTLSGKLAVQARQVRDLLVALVQ